MWWMKEIEKWWRRLIIGGEENKNEERELTGHFRKFKIQLHINLSFMSNYTHALHIIMIFQTSPWNFYLNNLILISIIFLFTPSYTYSNFIHIVNLPFYPSKSSNFYFSHSAKVKDVTSEKLWSSPNTNSTKRVRSRGELPQPKIRVCDQLETRITLVSEAYNITSLMKIWYTLSWLRRLTEPAI